MNESVGRVTALWRFPVKSMQGETLDEVALTAGGFAGDRAYAVIDTETGHVVSAKSTRRFPGMLQCAAAFTDAPEAGKPVPPVRVTLSDGTSVVSGEPGADTTLSRYFGREVRLAPGAPDDFTIDHSPADDATGLTEGTEVPQKLGAALFAESGSPSPVPPGALFDLFPVSVLTTSTLDALRRIRPESAFDARRFRMNVIVASDEQGFVENGWVERGLAMGDQVRLRVTMPDPRCVMVTLEQDELAADAAILRTLAQHNAVPAGGGRPMPCAGVYAIVEAPGTLRVGDAVAVA